MVGFFSQLFRGQQRVDDLEAPPPQTPRRQMDDYAGSAPSFQNSAVHGSAELDAEFFYSAGIQANTNRPSSAIPAIWQSGGRPAQGRRARHLDVGPLPTPSTPAQGDSSNTLPTQSLNLSGSSPFTPGNEDDVFSTPELSSTGTTPGLTPYSLKTPPALLPGTPSAQRAQYRSLTQTTPVKSSQAPPTRVPGAPSSIQPQIPSIRRKPIPAATPYLAPAANRSSSQASG